MSGARARGVGEAGGLRVRALVMARPHVAIAAALALVLLLVRAYELFAVRACLLSLALLPVGGFAVALPRAMRLALRVAVVVVACVAIALAQYFAITFVPLGADLLGYSFDDIRETTLASRGFGAAAFVPFVAAAVAAWIASGVALRRAPASSRTIVAAFVAMVTLSALAPIVAPRAAQYAADAPYFLAVNKVSFFAAGALRHLAERRAAANDAVTLSGYPLLHANRDGDVLGPLLGRADAPPSIVVLIVEGLGRDFMGQGARYAGFTPFLDSLSTQSLYWENHMSVSGRTFGVLPALLGSLPFGPGGFMELGTAMPRHITLPSVLKDAGYEVSYFTGTQGHFDNIDVFMERQGVDRFVDANAFGPGYERAPASVGGESWGYGDQDLFRRAMSDLPRDGAKPRLDVYLTVTTHEPFIPPRTAEYNAAFRRRLDALRPDASVRGEYEKYAGVFASLLYVDDGIRQLVQAYRARRDFARTIFVITGDHRLIPVPAEGRLDRYHVPLLVYSPLVAAPQRFSSVSSHLDVTPTLLAHLRTEYGVAVPDSVSWLGSSIDTAHAFRSTRSVALMRGKGQADEYLDGTTFVSGDQAFVLDSAFRLRRAGDDSTSAAARAKLAQFLRVNRFVSTGDHLHPGGRADTTNAVEARRQDSAVAALGLSRRKPTEVFVVARELAVAKQYASARLVLRRLLRTVPNYHDARVLLARSYAWEQKFDIARTLLDDLARRAPSYPDGYAARVELELFTAHPAAALRIADSAVARFSHVGDLRLGRARALEQLGRRRDALAALDGIAPGDPAAAMAADVRRRLLLQQ